MTLLTPLEQRILGCLIEKQLSTPDVYPLSLNGLVNACNQSSNREPVLALTEPEIQEGVDSLVASGLAETWPGRVVKYAHLARQRFYLSEQEAAILAELLVRGPQTPGELRTNTRRMYAFPDLAEVEAGLAALMEAEPPLVLRLAKAPGAREARVTHLLGGPVESAVGPVGAPAPASRLTELEQQVSLLRAELMELRGAFEAFKSQFE